jgi:YHS domain-containing protein
MVSRKSFLSALSVALIAGVTVWAGEVKLDGITCVVAPKAVNASKSASYKDGKVYFCCGNCAGKFATAPEKFATKANMQLVATGQYEQKACPYSGGELDPSTKIKVGEAEVAFCCANCKGKTEAAEADKQVDMVFGEKAFKKAGFAKVSG